MEVNWDYLCGLATGLCVWLGWELRKWQMRKRIEKSCGGDVYT
jgi:hypothetical protein